MNKTEAMAVKRNAHRHKREEKLAALQQPVVRNRVGSRGEMAIVQRLSLKKKKTQFRCSCAPGNTFTVSSVSSTTGLDALDLTGSLGLWLTLW